MNWILIFISLFSSLSAFASRLDPVIEAGRRGLSWLDRVNATLEKGATPLDFYSVTITHTIFPETDQSPENPDKYNEDILLHYYDEMLKQAPSPFVETVTGTGSIPSTTLGLTNDEFLMWGQTLNYIYQMSSRWQMKIPYLDVLKREASKDVRSYIYFKNNPSEFENLKNWRGITYEQRQLLSKHLLKMCDNTGQSRYSCQYELNQSVRDEGNAVAYFWKYFPKAEAAANGILGLKTRRNDIRWNSSNPNKTIVQFAAPASKRIQDWIKETLESIWKFEDWSVEIVFTKDKFQTRPTVRFTPNGTASITHVGGNLISLDSSLPLNQASAKQALGHEFGHVLGFDECYTEFYDSDENAIVFYALDPTNIMCNVDGKMTKAHFDALKAAYYRN